LGAGLSDQSEGTRSAFLNGGYQRYFNGAAPGRTALIGASNMLQLFLSQAWNQPAWRFRPPQTIAELGEFLGVEIRAVAALYNSSDYEAPAIGGQVQLEFVSAPGEAIRL
jgi:hypothetical protein